MTAAQRASAAILIGAVLALAPACAQEAARVAHTGADVAARACLNQKEQRQLAENGTVLHLVTALHDVRSHVSGTLVRARLCHRGDGFVYVLTLLAHDGKVTRLVVDAAKGTVVGER